MLMRNEAILAKVRETLIEQKTLEVELEKLRVEFNIPENNLQELQSMLARHKVGQLNDNLFANGWFVLAQLRADDLAVLYSRLKSSLIERGFTADDAQRIVEGITPSQLIPFPMAVPRHVEDDIISRREQAQPVGGGGS